MGSWELGKKARSIGSTARRLLWPGARATVRARFRQSLVAVTPSDELVVLSSLAERAPWAVCVPGLPLERVAPGDERLVVGPGDVLLLERSGLRVALAEAEVWVPPPAGPLATPQAVCQALELLNLPWPPPGLAGFGCERLLAALQSVAAAGVEDSLAAAAAPLVGLGRGLTPAGDDLLTGLLGTAVLLGLPPIELNLAGRTTLLAATQLNHARRGELIEPLHLMIAALAAASPEAPAAARRLLALGHTSGADMLAGVRLGLAYALASPGLA